MLFQLIFFFFCAITYCNAVCSHGAWDFGGVNNADIQIILNKHNEVRKLIANGKVSGQPRGVNLKRLVWDAKLAKDAQNIANTCVFEHVKVHDKRWAVGQNLFKSSAYSYSKATDWNSAVQAWFNEYKKYKYPGGFSKETGHYTQVVWADTKYIGCGYIQYPEGKSYSKLYVCNYGPAGNWAGQAPYRKGKNGCENLC